MKGINYLRRYHRWIMAFAGLQCLIWAASGVYMVLTDIHFIHGESLLKPATPISSPTVPFSELAKAYPRADSVTLLTIAKSTVYKVEFEDAATHVIDAKTGKVLAPISTSKALAIAQQSFADSRYADKIKSIHYYSETDSPPSDVSPRWLPFWRVEFDAPLSPTLYIQANTGEIVSKRHDMWRLFDWMWRFHIMDYDDGENINNPLLMFFSVISLFGGVAGATLLVQRLRAPQATQKGEVI
ncbi:PepSY domain-containing protein [Aestuariibacter sp. AA17]|uniref:PepSY domain-containing protein n=1 Tax=Fluctibacter corallii TaxID=2984329 RepID=A0ABT3A4D0_9ALTE|nr:PepSY domain-containing protein [Aestuariibacter sp. AA17]MCV2883389.1 PepSY domain-containing protein [Aestuariibacter sp. AA17]